MRALVTGAAGYIGRILCRMLQQEGWHVTANDLLYDQSWELTTNDWWIGSYSDPELYAHVEYDVVLHLGANSLLGPSVKDPLNYINNNVSKLNTMLTHLNLSPGGIPPIIFASSAATYGDPGADLALREEHAGAPINPYGWSKLMGEHILEQACLAYGSKAYAMRFFNVAGSYEDLGQDLDQPHILTKMCQVSLKRGLFTINGWKFDTYDGTCVRDYIHVTDVCAALIAAAKTIVNDAPTSFTEYNVCSQTKTSNQDLANTVDSMFGLYYKFSNARPGDPGYLYGNNHNIMTELNWKPKMDLHDIIESHYDFVRKNLND